MSLNGHASNLTYDPYGTIACSYDLTDPSKYGFDRSDATPLPFDLLGSVTAKNKGPLSVDFVWSGPGAAPDHADFLVSTHLSVSAGADYGRAGALSGVSAAATARLPDQKQEVDATAGDAGWASPPTLDGYHLVRVTPSGGRVTVSIKGEVQTTTSNSLPYAAWVPGYEDFYYCGDPYNGPTGSRAFASVMATASPDSRNREVLIACPAIEDSNASGPTPDVRDPTGAITVDSAVVWGQTLEGADPGTVTSTSGWLSSQLYIANTPGFVHPLFSWDVAGDGELHSRGGYWQTYDGYWSFGPSYGNFLSKSTTLTVTVQDSPQPDQDTGASGDGATAANTYTIRWHYPYENWQRNGAAFNNPPTPYPARDGPQGAGGQVHIPISAAKSDWSVAGKIASGIIATGAAAFPETDPIILGFAAATGASLGSINPPPPPTEYTKDGTLSQFQSDVSTENSIASGNTSGVLLPDKPRMDPNFASAVFASGSYNGYFSGNIPGGPQGSLSFNATAYRLQWQQNYSGDAYGVKGYVGSAPSFVKWEGKWDYVFNWTWAPTGGPGPR